jgi:hypothetical protein
MMSSALGGSGGLFGCAPAVRRKRGISALSAVLCAWLASATLASAQSCNAEGTACIDTAGPLRPAQVIQFRVEAGATLVAADFAQPSIQVHGAVKQVSLVASGSPGGLDTYQGIVPGERDRLCSLGGGCLPRQPLGDAPTTIHVDFQSPSTGSDVFHEAEYETVGPTSKRSAHVLTRAPGEVVGQFAFEARREVRVTVDLVLSGKRKHSEKGWREFDRESIDEVVGPGLQELLTPPLRRRCPRRFDKCRADVEAEVLTEAAGYWWGSGVARARLRRLR